MVDLKFFVKRFWAWKDPTAPREGRYWWEVLFWTMRATIDDFSSLLLENETLWDLLESERADRLKLEHRVRVLERRLLEFDQKHGGDIRAIDGHPIDGNKYHLEPPVEPLGEETPQPKKGSKKK